MSIISWCKECNNSTLAFHSIEVLTKMWIVADLKISFNIHIHNAAKNMTHISIYSFDSFTVKSFHYGILSNLKISEKSFPQIN